MAYRGKILIADDEAVFLNSTADLLRREGYECDCAVDGFMAVEKLQCYDYDLLIADIKMNGNAELELVRHLQQMFEGLPVILVTGYPALTTAIQSINLPVSAYLVKPVEFTELLHEVQEGIKKYRLFRFLHDIRMRVVDWAHELECIESAMKHTPDGAVPLSMDSFIMLTCQNIMGSVTDLRTLLAQALPSIQPEPQEVCHLLNCPRLNDLNQALNETIDVLETTKQHFKSKQLGLLREKLKKIVDRIN